MFISRRLFVSGLTAFLSVVTIPGISASKDATQKPEKEFFDFEEDGVYVEYLKVDERPEMLGGSAKQPGWYLHPICCIGCCKSEGPFSSRKVAFEADRVRWERIRRSQSEKNKERDMGEIEPF